MPENALLSDALRQSLWAATILASPVLAAALVIGLAVGLLQALTSVQEMTLTFVPKMAGMLVAFWLSMDFMLGTLLRLWDQQVLPMISGGAP